MIIDVKNENGIVTIIPGGNIDYVTAPELDEKVESIAPEAEEMIFDMSKVSYISSAGLRSILNADELMEDKNGIKLVNVNKDVKSILDMTNFSSMLNIE